ncbi:hypothetical protein ABC347_16885 [Sphingomonas sp. 1P06PA]
MTKLDLATVRRTALSAVAALVLSTTCVVAAVGPARAAESGVVTGQRA